MHKLQTGRQHKLVAQEVLMPLQIQTNMSFVYEHLLLSLTLTLNKLLQITATAHSDSTETTFSVRVIIKTKSENCIFF